MHRALIHVLVGLIALLAEPGFFFRGARPVRWPQNTPATEANGLILWQNQLAKLSIRIKNNAPQCKEVLSNSFKFRQIIGGLSFFLFFFVLLVKHIS